MDEETTKNTPGEDKSQSKKETGENDQVEGVGREAPQIDSSQNKQGEEDVRHPSIRTYYDDVADAVQKQQVSMSKMVLAEKKRQEQQEAQAPPKEPKKSARERLRGVFAVIVALLLLVGGAGAGYLVYLTFIVTEEVPVVEQYPSPITVDATEVVDASNFGKQEIIQTIENELPSLNIPRGGVGTLVLVTPSGDPEIPPRPVTAQEFFTALNTRASTALIRSLDPEFVLGGYGAPEKTESFLILRTDFFESTFAGMLAWEQDILADLPFFRQANPQTGTSTPLFRDQIIANQDARVLADASGNIHLAYSFPNEETLIISNSTDALIEIFDRLSVSTFE